ncbi:hypothetical protein P5673_029590 [Acropora cervicornis]|uniref:Uncharacterized protein n=1 Tax=Acropora cervicornis TaxID=6130 RepID=A0AAD9PVJ7_ACRCE|nr:hypothetical protein P5673_029590 [Acropora cervicornis]
MVKEGFNFVGTVHWADKERGEGWEPEGNVPLMLHYRFVKGEREKMVDTEMYVSGRLHDLPSMEKRRVL